MHEGEHGGDHFLSVSISAAKDMKKKVGTKLRWMNELKRKRKEQHWNWLDLDWSDW